MAGRASVQAGRKSVELPQVPKIAVYIVGFIPAFFGLAITLPILGHATWHLYRKVVGA